MDDKEETLVKDSTSVMRAAVLLMKPVLRKEVHLTIVGRVEGMPHATLFISEEETPNLEKIIDAMRAAVAVIASRNVESFQLNGEEVNVYNRGKLQ